MIEIIWEYTVRPECVEEFLKHYSSTGTWVAFFRPAAGYQGTTLRRDTQNGLRYVTVDRWSSLDAYQAFTRRNEAEYKRIDAMCGTLTQEERRVGVFEAV